jgi:two-component system response regulator ChvI
MPATLEQMTTTSLSSAGPVVPFAHVREPGTIRVLLVEDDQIYRDSLSNELSKHGFAVHGFADGASLLGALDSAIDADIIILDWGLPKTLGIDLLPQLRRHGVTLPVVFLSGRAMPANESLAFDRGAIDFIDKARGVEVLVRRLRRVVKASNRTEQLQTDRSMICGNLLLRPDVSRAYWKDTDLDLTLGEYNIVYLLASNVGKYVTYRAIYDRLRHEGFIAGDGPDGYRANVRSAIKRIRNKFRACDPTFDKIENYTAFGYCWKKLD